MYSTIYYFQKCRDGFNHVGILICDGVTVRTAKVHYINRTWESYDGQTARQKVTKEEINVFEDWAKSLAKRETGKNWRSQDTKKAYQNILAGSSKYQELKKHYESL